MLQGEKIQEKCLMEVNEVSVLPGYDAMSTGKRCQN